MLRRDSDREPNDAEKPNFELGSGKALDIKDPERAILRNLEMNYPNRSNMGMCKLLNEVRLRSIAGSLTLRLLMSYIYMEHLFLMFLDHTQRHTTVGRTPLDE